LGAGLFKLLELHLIQFEHVPMKRMHFSNGELNTKFPIASLEQLVFSVGRTTTACKFQAKRRQGSSLRQR
jgi:hypothetical protein